MRTQYIGDNGRPDIKNEIYQTILKLEATLSLPDDARRLSDVLHDIMITPSFTEKVVIDKMLAAINNVIDYENYSSEFVNACREQLPKWNERLKDFQDIPEWHELRDFVAKSFNTHLNKLDNATGPTTLFGSNATMLIKSLMTFVSVDSIENDKRLGADEKATELLTRLENGFKLAYANLDAPDNNPLVQSLDQYLQKHFHIHFDAKSGKFAPTKTEDQSTKAYDRAYGKGK